MSAVTRDLAGAAIGVGVIGVAPVAALILADEVEHFRCGIGCVIVKDESTGKFIVDRMVSQKSPDSPNKLNNHLDEGDTILKIEDTWLHSHHSVQDVSSLIRGKEGTAVRLLVVKTNERTPALVSITRRRLAGSKTEMLGALWQARMHPCPLR
jgi:C-terminal processing protease CtpA/Prc